MSRLRWLLSPRRAHEDLTREMHAHIEERVDELIEEGFRESDARRQARREFGNVTARVEQSREVWIAAFLTSVWQDLRYAFRSVRRRPGFALGTTGILALGLGLVMALVTVINPVLQPWPVPDSDAVAVVSAQPASGEQYGTLSAPEYRYLREHSRSFSALAARLQGGSTVRLDDVTAFVQTNYVTWNFFEALQGRALQGRLFEPGDEDYVQPQAVAVISDQLWRRTFQSAPAIVGRTLFVDGMPFTIIGVASTYRVASADLWMPLPSIDIVHPPADDSSQFERVDIGFSSSVFGRLAPGATRGSARAELDGLSRQFRGAAGLAWGGFRLTSTRPLLQDPAAVRRAMPIVGLILGALLLVMLLACANVGNLLLARGLSRRDETTVRLSLGASRGRIVRQFVTEAAVLSTAAAVVGVWIGWMIPLAAVTLFPGTLRVDPTTFQPDLLTSATAAVLGLLALLVSGLPPALSLSRVPTSATGSRGVVARGVGRLRVTFLAVQIALSMVLLVSAGLLTRAIAYGLRSDPGFAIHDVDVVTFSLAGADADRRVNFMRTLGLEAGRASALHVATGEFSAISSAWRQASLRTIGEQQPVSRVAVQRAVSAAYFTTLDIPLVEGRTFSPESGAREVVLNETAARALWPETAPIGRQLEVRTGEEREPFVVVGVAADVPVIQLGRIDPVVYVRDESSRIWFVRRDSAGSVERLTAVARSIDPSVQVSARPLADDLDASVAPLRAGSYFAWGAGGLALFLATAGAVGVFGYMAEERRREIGIRLALGATSASVVRTIVAGVGRPLALGLGVGLLLAVSGAQFLRSFLYGLSPLDPVTYLGIIVLLAAAALVATWLPARRAARTNPAITLRAE